jgi:cyclin-dependent kinase regulatory subunit CKS1
MLKLSDSKDHSPKAHDPSSNSASSSVEFELQKAKDIKEHSPNIFYSQRYSDDHSEYRHVILPKPLAKYIPKDRLMTESEWRALGVQQSPGWTHYMIHKPEPHILLFKRTKN